MKKMRFVALGAVKGAMKGVVAGLVTAALMILVVSCASKRQGNTAAADTAVEADQAGGETGPRVLRESDLEKSEFSRLLLDGLFTLEDDSPYDASELEGKYVLLNVWASWCPDCESDRALVDAFYRRCGSDTVTVLAVSYGERPEDVRAFVAERNYSFPVVMDTDKSLKAYVSWLPTTFILDPGGQILAAIVDAWDWTDPASLAVLRGVIPGLALE